jgi:hypothetical protein
LAKIVVFNDIMVEHYFNVIILIAIKVHNAFLFGQQTGQFSSKLAIKSLIALIV